MPDKPSRSSILSLLPRDHDGDHHDDMFKRAVPTGEILTAALGRLTNASLDKLLGELAEAINSCCQDNKPSWPAFPPSSEPWHIEIYNNLQSLRTDITTIRAEINKRVDEVGNVVVSQKIDVKILDFLQAVFKPTINEITVKIDRATTVINNFFSSSTDTHVTLVQILQFIANVKVEIENAHATFVKYEQQLTDINVDLTSVKADIKVLKESIDASLKKVVDKHEERLTILENELKLLERGDTLPREVIQDVIVNIVMQPSYAIQIFDSVKITINNTSKTLFEVLQILAGAEAVREVKLIYSDTSIIGATYTLTDGSSHTFKARFQNLGDDLSKYIFETDWNGLPASFAIVFRETTRRWNVCKKEVKHTSYDPISSSNIEFSLV